MRHPLYLLLAIFVIACSTPKKKDVEIKPTQVELETNYGKIMLALSDKTPLHKANFLKLVEEGLYDSLLFHRVIDGFVIQGGDPDSKYASPTDTLGSGGLDYRVPAEFDPTLYHKRGAVGTARNNNPERESSSTQFYIVQAGPVADSIIDKHEERINKWLATYYVLHAPENKLWLDSLTKAMDTENWRAVRSVNDTINVLAETFTDFEPYIIPEEHREVYRTLGGTPMLDQNYTVFAEVISGMDVVDSIAATQTNSMDRPLQDVRILKARVIDR